MEDVMNQEQKQEEEETITVDVEDSEEKVLLLKKNPNNCSSLLNEQKLTQPLMKSLRIIVVMYKSV